MQRSPLVVGGKRHVSFMVAALRQALKCGGCWGQLSNFDFTTGGTFLLPVDRADVSPSSITANSSLREPYNPVQSRLISRRTIMATLLPSFGGLFQGTHSHTPRYPYAHPNNRSLNPARQRHRRPFRGQISRSKYTSPPTSTQYCTLTRILRNAVGWGSTQSMEPSFGGGMQDTTSVKAKLINLINSVRTLMRST